MEKTSEKYFERNFYKFIKNEMHGVAVKIKSPTMNGLPDRLVILPGGLTCFAEIKSTGKDLSDVQKVVVPMLRRLGHQVYIIDDMQSLETAKQQIRLLC